jgi:ribosomal protein S18 acetylase RimI-like enzyme/uncharacterized protein YciI
MPIHKQRNLANNRFTHPVLGSALLLILVPSSSFFLSTNNFIREYSNAHPSYKNNNVCDYRPPTTISMTTATTESTSADSSSGDGIGNSELQGIQFRQAAASDIVRCFEIESASYPSDEAATMESLINRQKYAGDYFLMCTTTMTLSGDESEEESIVGFVCATRCHEFTEESMSELHDPTGRFLAIHSVVIDEDYRRNGFASKLLKTYVRNVLEAEKLLEPGASAPIESIVLISKQHLLGFYVRCGFRVNRPSPIVHGKELWYDLEMELAPQPTIRTQPLPGESWFCKTETFKPSLPFPKIKPHLDAHTKWVEDLRAAGETCIVSGYRVDSEGKPGGGGLMFLAAKSYEEAYELVANNDPLIVNGCVDWELNGWKSQAGGITVD